MKGVSSPKWGWDSYRAWSIVTCNAGFLGPFPLWQSLAPGSGGALQPHQDGHTLHFQHPPTRGDLHSHTPPTPLGTRTVAGSLGVGCRHAHLAPFTCWQAIWCTRTAKFWTLTVAQKTTSWFLSCSMMLAQGRVARKSHLWGLRQGRGLVVSDTGSSSPFLPTLQLCNYLVLNPRRNWGSSWVFKSYWVYQNQFRCLCRSVTGTHTKTICILTSLCVEPSSTPSSPHRTCLTKQVSQDIKQWRNYKHHLVPSF